MMDEVSHEKEEDGKAFEEMKRKREWKEEGKAKGRAKWSGRMLAIWSQHKEIFICALLGAVVFVLIYGGYILNPCYTDWLLTSEDGDLTQHYLGWKFYRHAPWRFPVGLIDTMAYPNATSVIFTDSIPLFAFIFKVFRFLLPAKFQYFGWFGLMCFMLQGGIGAKLVKRYAENSLWTVLGGMFFVICPVFIDRMYWMTSLASHFLCLLGIMFVAYYESIYKETKKAVIGWGILGMLSAGIHIYFLPMGGVILLGFVLLDLVKGKKKWKAFLPIGSYLLAAAVTVFLFGGFGSGMKASNDGLGHYSFNLNGLWNPHGWSKYWKDMYYTDSQYEGFGYLGLGLMVLFLWALLMQIGEWLEENKKIGWDISEKRLVTKALKADMGIEKSIGQGGGKGLPANGGRWLERHIQTAVWCFIGVLSLGMSASHVVMYGAKVLYEMPLPDMLYKAWSIFRATGRLIWPLVYLIVLGGVCMGRKKPGRRTGNLVLAVCLVLQLADIRGMLAQKHEIYAKEDKYQTLLPSEGWKAIGEDKDLKHICFVSDVANSRKQLFSFGDFASDYGLTLSNFYFARSLGDKEREAREKALAECPPDTVFIFFDNERQKGTAYPLHYYSMDGLIAGCSVPLEIQEPLPGEELLRYQYDMGSGRYLNNGEVTEEGWLIHPYGNTYGPYLYALPGTYRVEMSGNNMSGSDVKCYYSHGDVNLEPYNVVIEENRVSYEVELGEPAEDLEFALWNTGGGDMIVGSVAIEKVN